MKNKVRTFVAVEIDEGVRNRASRLIKELRQSGADVAWVAPENMHITLKFLGDVEYKDVYHVCRAIEESVADVEPFSLEIKGTGAFPSLSRPHVIWLGVDLGASEIAALSEKVEVALSRLGFRPEARRFHAHLTLGRVRKSGRAVEHLVSMLREHEQTDFGPTVVDQVVIFSSELQPTGPIYEAMGHVELKG